MNTIIPFYSPSEKILVKSEGCYQYDAEGKQYIDFESGVWCANLGHSNHKIVEVIKSQIETSIHHGYKFRNSFSEVLSIELQRLIGFSEGASVFLSSGSESINLAITLSQYLTGRKKILKIDNSYLSAFGYGRISSDNNELINVPFNDTSTLNSVNFYEISAFVIETGGASVDMVRFPNREFIARIVEKSIGHGCLIVADEVTTGMGRLGKWFGFQHYDFTPDIVVTGKALGNGYPISAVTLNNKAAKQFAKQPFRYAQSHQNDPLGCAIGIEVIRYIEDNNLILQSSETGQYFRTRLEALQNKYPQAIKDIRGRGLMLAVELETQTNGENINRQLFEQGFVVGYKSNTLRFLPPLTISTKDIDNLTGKMEYLLSIKNSKVF